MYKRQYQGHDGVALELVLTAIFASIGEVSFSAIVIDKYKTLLNSIKNIVNMDEHC